MKKKVTISIPGTKECNSCLRELPVDNFYVREGYGYKDNLFPQCKECNNKKQKEWRHKNPEKRSQMYKRWRKDHHRNVWVTKTRCNHKISGCKIDFSHEWLLSLANKTEHCYICGRKLDWGYGKGKPAANSPSLDRIDNEVTLTESNVNIACFRCNRIKGASTLSEFVEFCRHILEYQGGM